MSVRDKAKAYTRWLQALTIAAPVEIQNSWDDLEFYSGSRTPGRVVGLTDKLVIVEFDRKGKLQRKVFSRWTGRENRFAQLAPAENEVRYSPEIAAFYLTMEPPARRGELALEQLANSAPS